MKLIRVGAAVLNQTPLDWDGNCARIRGAIAAARQAGVSILCLPELCITGYGCEDAFHAPGTQQMALDVLARAAARNARHGRLARPAAAVSRGAVQHGAAWSPMARFSASSASRTWRAKAFTTSRGGSSRGRKACASRRRSAGRSYPLGDLIFDIGGVRIGFEICEDAWVADRPGGNLARHGVDLILNPSASHFAFGKHEIRKRFVTEGSRAFNVGYIYANLLGNESGRAIYDGDAMIAAGRQAARHRAAVLVCRLARDARRASISTPSA